MVYLYVSRYVQTYFYYNLLVRDWLFYIIFPHSKTTLFLYYCGFIIYKTYRYGLRSHRLIKYKCASWKTKIIKIVFYFNLIRLPLLYITSKRL